MECSAKKFIRNQSGATAIEYAMIACFVFVVIVSAVAGLGTTVSTTLYDKIATAF